MQRKRTTQPRGARRGADFSHQPPQQAGGSAARRTAPFHTAPQLVATVECRKGAQERRTAIRKNVSDRGSACAGRGWHGGCALIDHTILSRIFEDYAIDSRKLVVWRNLFAERFRDNGEEGARHGRSLINTGTFPLRTTRHWDGTTAAVLSWKGRSALSGLGNVDDGRTGWTLPPPRDSAPPPASSPSAGGRGYHSGVVLPIATVEAVAAVAESALPAAVSSRERQQQRRLWY